MSADTALVIVAHGSPRPSANGMVQELADAVRARGHFCNVCASFITGASPTIPEALNRCAEMHPRRIVVVPLFLHPGTHVLGDIPEILNRWRADHPNVELLLGRHVGAMPQVSSALAIRAEEAAHTSPFHP